MFTIQKYIQLVKVNMYYLCVCVCVCVCVRVRVRVCLCVCALKHWEVFQEVTEIFILVPSALGLKGNLEMTLASRLSTAVSTCKC